MKECFTLIGFVSTITVCIGLLAVVAHECHERIATKMRHKKRLYEIEHRYEKPPLAACHCVTCRYCGGFTNCNEEPPRRVDCHLWGSKIIVRDDSFCYRAELREEFR